MNLNQRIRSEARGRLRNNWGPALGITGILIAGNFVIALLAELGYYLTGLMTSFGMMDLAAAIRAGGIPLAGFFLVPVACAVLALLLFLTLYDYLTLKTGILTQPFVPCMNYIINAFLVDYKMLADCTLNTLKLLFLGYSIGVSLGLVTGIACGYSKRIRYWIDPIIKFLGPIPTSTWIPIIMVIASSLFGGAVFIIGLSSWFAVTVASLTGISNVGKEFFEAAKTLGANDRQLVFRVAIPHAMPSILQGCTQAMSSSCIVIMIAEMLGVKSGLGWYMTWQTGWASYDKSFAALFVICFIFTLVTKGLERIKRYLLRWQNGAEK